jgi:hypothetical protein
MRPTDVRRLAGSLPEVEERETWGEATFRVRGRIFAILSADGAHTSVKAAPEEQAALVGSDPRTFAVAAYTGRFGWVRVTLARVDPAEMRELLEEAWRRTAPRRIVAAFDEASTACS